MTTTAISLDDIYTLAKKTLTYNGCDELHAESVAKTVTFIYPHHYYFLCLYQSSCHAIMRN